MSIVCFALYAYQLCLFAWVLLSWVRVPSTHPVAKLELMLNRLIYPVILPLRRVVPPLRLGGVALDLSVILLFIVIRLISGFVCS